MRNRENLPEVARVHDDLPALASDAVIDIAANAEKRVEAIKKIKAITLKVTNPADWIDMDGKPYLQASGAEKAARLFGVSWRLDPIEWEDAGEGHRDYEVKGHYSMGDITIEAIGTRSSRDKFYSRAHGADKPASEIDMNDVKKAAVSNCIANGVGKLLGIRNMTWEEIRQAGIDPGKTPKVKYDASKGKMDDKVLQKRDEIREMILEIVGGDTAAAKAYLFDATTWTDKLGKEVPGKDSIEKLTEKQIPVAHREIKEKYEVWKRIKSDLAEDAARAIDEGEID